MSSVLIITADYQSSGKISEVAQNAGYRVRSVPEPSHATEWLSMQSFEVVLIDARYPSATCLDILEMAWKQNPLTVGCIFNLYEHGIPQWNARLAGARIYTGPRALEGIIQLFETLPQIIPQERELSVLLVDDLDAPRDIVRSFIEAMGFKTEAAGSVDDALNQLKKEPTRFFCVTTDLNMPHKSGLDLLDTIRKDPKLQHLPVLVLTAYSTLDNLIECVRQGATGFLVKPPKKKALRQELEKAKRIMLTKHSPRLCDPAEADQLEDVLSRYTTL